MSDFKYSLHPDYTSLDAETRILRSNSMILRHPSYCLLSGLINIGTCEIVEVGHKISTAATDGANTWFNRAFVMSLSEQEVNFLVLHELSHKAFMHLYVYDYLNEIDAARSNKAVDYVGNGWIVDTEAADAANDPGKVPFTKMIPGSLYKKEWSNMSAHEIFKLLESEETGHGGQGGGDEADEGGAGLDSHDWESAQELTEEEAKELQAEVEQALREGAVMVGKLKGNVDRRIHEALTPKIDWREVWREFLSSISSGKDIYDWRSFNRRYAHYDIFLPSTVSESMGEIGIGVDTSGSIGDAQLQTILGEIIDLAKAVNPERIRIFFWDHEVQKEQVIERDNSSRIQHIFSAAGGGGTRAGSVSDYIKEKNYKLEALCMFTDGYTEDPIRWEVNVPTLWVVDGKPNFRSPDGHRVVKY